MKINQCIYRTPNISLQTEKDVLIYIYFNTCYRANIFRTRVDFVFRKDVGGSDAFLRLIYCVDIRQLNFRVGEGPIPRHNNKHLGQCVYNVNRIALFVIKDLQFAIPLSLRKYHFETCA